MTSYDQIFIRDLRAYGIIGVYPAERSAPQEILINLVLYTDLEQAGKSDQVQDSVDYHQTADAVRHLAETAQRFTVEALANDIAAYCLQIPGVNGVRVRIEKPAAIPEARAAGVEIERFQPQNR